MIKLDLFDVKALIALETAFWKTRDADYYMVIYEKYFKNVDDTRLKNVYEFIRNHVRFLEETNQKIDANKIIEKLKCFDCQPIKIVKKED